MGYWRGHAQVVATLLVQAEAKQTQNKGSLKCLKETKTSFQIQCIFEKFNIKKLRNDLGKNAAAEVLDEIKKLIEATKWDLGIGGSESIIKIDKTDCQVPKHIYEIYSRLNQDTLSPEQKLKEIKAIANRTLAYNPSFFGSIFGKRAQTTQSVYEEIAKLSLK